ncbi:unnamed protein product [Acidithrix sp. C25]|nr:unnamed protein product [Acidithrix sp. C25]
MGICIQVKTIQTPLLPAKSQGLAVGLLVMVEIGIESRLLPCGWVLA